MSLKGGGWAAYGIGDRYERTSRMTGAEFDTVLDAARVGAEWAVAVLFRDVQPRLLRYLRAKAPDVAEDLASEVWFAAARQLPGFVGDESAFRWLAVRNRPPPGDRPLAQDGTAPHAPGFRGCLRCAGRRRRTRGARDR